MNSLLETHQYKIWDRFVLEILPLMINHEEQKNGPMHEKNIGNVLINWYKFEK